MPAWGRKRSPPADRAGPAAMHGELGDDGFDGQTSRVVDVFALVYAAGCLTIEYGITPWSKQRLLEAVKTVFADYDHRRLVRYSNQ